MKRCYQCLNYVKIDKNKGWCFQHGTIVLALRRACVHFIPKNNIRRRRNIENKPWSIEGAI